MSIFSAYRARALSGGTVGGFDRVYEINRNFRNEHLGQHNPNSTILEFYQASTGNYHAKFISLTLMGWGRG